MSRRIPLLIWLIILAACAPAEPTPVALVPSRILNFWQPVRDTLPDAATTHPWQFAAMAGDSVRLYVTGQGVQITLTGGDGAALAQGGNVETTLPASGVYTAIVSQTRDQPTAYTLLLEYTDRPDPSKLTLTPTVPTLTPTFTPTLTPTPAYAPLGTPMGEVAGGQTRDGTLVRASERQLYLLNGVAGQYISVRVESLSGGLDPVVTLFDPDGQPMGMDDDTGGNNAAFLQNILLPADGAYIIQTGGSPPGAYRLTVSSSTARQPVTPIIPPSVATPTETPTPASSADRLYDHSPINGAVSAPGELRRFLFFANAGDTLTVGVSPVTGEALRPKVELYNTFGELMLTASASDSNAGGDALLHFIAPDAGAYQLVVGAESGTGSYIISYGVGASREDVARGLIAPDQELAGEVARRGLRDVWTLYLSAGDVIAAAAASRSATFDPALDLVAPGGEIIASDDDGGGARDPLIASATAPVSGLYRLRVTGSEAASSGVYTIVWRYISAAPTPTPIPARVRLLTLDDVMPPERRYLDFPFRGQAGQRVEIRAEALPGTSLDLVGALLAPDGTVIGEGDDSGGTLNPVISAELPADGTYIVRLNEYAGAGGAFMLVVDLLV